MKIKVFMNLFRLVKKFKVKNKFDRIIIDIIDSTDLSKFKSLNNFLVNKFPKIKI